MINNKILIGAGQHACWLRGDYANRHGLIAGATGTGKTVTLQVLAEGFARMGTPVFMADVKGDLSGISQAGRPHPKIDERLQSIGQVPDAHDTLQHYKLDDNAVTFWDVFGDAGHPIRATVAEMGPLLLSRMLELNDTQEGVLNVVFRVADDEDWLLLDLKDLRAMLRHVAKNAKTLSIEYGNIAPASVAAIQRRLLVLEQQGGHQFFGEPALDLNDLMRTARHADGTERGMINILAADKLIQRPRLYATMLLWLLAEMFERLPEVGDPEIPKLVFFFDEAHLLFDDAPKALVRKIENVVRLIRSKGVGVYFVTQNPLDVPDTVLGQLGNRVQHALRAYTPREQRAVKAAAETFRPNPRIDVKQAITELGVGEGLVSTLEDKGIPSIVERCLVCPPQSRIGPATTDERQAILAQSAMGAKYDTALDRRSAFEILQTRHEQMVREQEQADTQAEQEKERADASVFGEELSDDIFDWIGSGSSRRRSGRATGRRKTTRKTTRKSRSRTTSSRKRRTSTTRKRRSSPRRRRSTSSLERIGEDIGASIGREILRGIFGSLK